MGVPVVTTPVGAEGLEGATCLAIADSAIGFVTGIQGLLDDKKAWATRTKEGTAYVRVRFSRAALGRALLAAIVERGVA